MRPALLLARCLLALAAAGTAAADGFASPPFFRPRASESGEPGSAPLSPGARAPRLPRKPLGVDQAERVRQTAGVQYRALVILVQFSDHPADTLNHTAADFADLLFSRGTHPTGSLRDYYNEVSRGAFDITGDVLPWVTAPRTYAQYTNGQSGFGVPPNNAQQMALDVVRLVDPTVDFAQYDNNGDGDVDALFIVHAGPGAEETGSDGDIWSHKWSLPGGPALVDGVLVRHYTTEPEEWQITTPWTVSGDLISVGVFCHEFGHVLGLPDLYDTSESGGHDGVGDWDLMATGLYAHRPGEAAGSKPTHLSAWSKMQLGWVQPVWVMQDSAGVTIPPVETGGSVFRLWTNGQEEGEFFLVENRQPIGFDAGLTRLTQEAQTPGAAHGLLIYHVDSGIIGNNDEDHKMLDVEEAGGVESGITPGVQNLDLPNGSSQGQTPGCGGSVFVRGNGGDAYDPWPGLAGRTSFNSNTCPSSISYCGQITHVGLQNITEAGQDVTADFFVSGTSVRRRRLIVNDEPFEPGSPNNGNGRAEPGETVRLYFPLQNLGTAPAGEFHAKVSITEPYAGLLADSIDYGMIGGGEVDTGTVIYAAINAAPDPVGVIIGYTVQGPAGVVLADSVQLLVGARSGICDTFEGTTNRWIAAPAGCGGVNEWHREAGVNHTAGGTFAWRLGPEGLIGSYSASQDARLVSQPIHVSGAGDTLRFWHRYDTKFGFDGLSVEISTSSGATWLPLQPVGGYNTGDRWSGRQATFTEAVVPLGGYSGAVQIAFRFRSQSDALGLGWWIDDVTVTGDASCATTAIAIERFEAAPSAADQLPPSIRLDWTVSRDGSVTVGIDRAAGTAARQRIVTLPHAPGEGSFPDLDVVPGVAYRYWLSASREGEPEAEAGPVEAIVPHADPASAPRVLALAPVRPNPFRGGAEIAVSLDRSGPVVVRVFGADGRLIRTLASGESAAADLRFHWDGRDDRGRPAAAGIYFVELRSGDRTRVQKAVFLR